MSEKRVILKSGKTDSLERKHPWIFSGAIKKIEGTPAEGDLVSVFSNKDEYLGTGHYQNGSIAVRVLSFERQIAEMELIDKQINSAFNLRKSLNLIDNKHTNVYRLIFAEGDNLPGLIVDVYNNTAVIQSHSIGMHRLKNQIADSIKTIMGNRIDTIYYKSADSLPKFLEAERENHFLLGSREEDVVSENAHLFKVNWVEGQKTGFFIDQRYNRELVGQYSDGRRVLNTYCYTGGFSIYALKGGASEVDSVDSSAKAIHLTNENVELSGLVSNHKSYTMDTMDYLSSADKKYDLIILDPPAFAKHIDVKHRAIQGYKRINLAALNKIERGGLLFTFSCSQVIDQRLFESTVTSAAILSGRKIRVLHHLSQPSDHPFSIYHPEGRYLKGLVLSVE